ncbi:MAG: ATP synthase F1 subunit epsilon [Candidatus Binatia bacterium]
MADTLTLQVLTPQRQVVDEPVLEVVAEGALGQFGILPDHAAFVTLLEPGLLTFRRPGGADETLAVKGGYAEVHDNVVTVLADDVLPLDRIDVTQARIDLEKADLALEEAPFGHADHERLRLESRWAAVRLALGGG